MAEIISSESLSCIKQGECDVWGLREEIIACHKVVARITWRNSCRTVRCKGGTREMLRERAIPTLPLQLRVEQIHPQSTLGLGLAFERWVSGATRQWVINFIQIHWWKWNSNLLSPVPLLQRESPDPEAQLVGVLFIHQHCGVVPWWRHVQESSNERLFMH